MRRRSSLALLGSAIAWPVAARGQQAALPVIGFLHSGSPTTSPRYVEGFRKGLSEEGFVEGRNVAIVFHWAEGRYDRLPALVADLVGRQVTVIFTAGGSEPARAAKAATTTIPIAFQSGADPIAAGLVASLSRPGGNVTGVSLMGSALEAKRLELVHEVAPKASAIASLVNPKYPDAKAQSAEVVKGAAQLGVTPIMLTASTAGEVDAAFALLDQRGAGALTVAMDPFFGSRTAQLVTLAARRALPAIYPLREYAVGGGLMSYGTDFADGFRQAGIYVGKILKGAKPAELPVLQPTKFDLVVNLKTAKALGLTVPPTLLVTADEVIE
jgi:putative ABC transport system substrate-binding protein